MGTAVIVGILTVLAGLLKWLVVRQDAKKEKADAEAKKVYIAPDSPTTEYDDVCERMRELEAEAAAAYSESEDGISCGP